MLRLVLPSLQTKRKNSQESKRKWMLKKTENFAIGNQKQQKKGQNHYCYIFRTQQL